MNQFPDAMPEKRPFYQVWIDALLKPTVENFESIANEPGASMGNSALWLFLALLVGGVVGSIVALPFNSAGLPEQLGPLLQNLPPESQEMLRSLFGGQSSGGLGANLLGIVCGAPVGALFALFFYFIGTGIQSWLATLFGGTGSFEKFFIVNAAYQTPVVLVTGILSSIPFVSCLASLIGLYAIYLNFVSLQAVHKLTSGKAVVVILIPILIGCLLSACLTIFGLALLGPAINDVFNSINSNMAP